MGDLRVAIIGFGLIGGSAGVTFKKHGATVLAVDSDPGTRISALAAGFEVAETIDSLSAFQPNFVIVSTPLSQVAVTVESVSKLVESEVTITDFGSVKAQVLKGFTGAEVPENYIPLHPMAGKETVGYKNSESDLLVAVPWIIVQLKTTKVERLIKLAAVISKVFSARLYLLNVEEHDKAVALISQLPHVIANALLSYVAQSSLSKLAFGISAGSFRDGTRVAGTAVKRTTSMVTDNAEVTAGLIDGVVAELNAISGSLRSGTKVAAFMLARDGRQVMQLVKDGSSETRVRLNYVDDNGLDKLRQLSLDGIYMSEITAGAGYAEIVCRGFENRA